MKTIAIAVTRVAATAALALGVASCKHAGSQDAIAVVTIAANGVAPAGIKRIQLQLALGGKTTSVDLQSNDGADVVLPTMRSLQLPATSGTLAVVATALDGDGNELGHGSATGKILAGST
jgi:hypothetical protein